MSDETGAPTELPEPSPGSGLTDAGAATPTEPRGRRKARLLLLAGVLAGLLLIAGGAVAGVLFVLRGTDDVLADSVPEDSLLYLTAYLDPAAGQKLALSNMLERFPELEGTDVGEQFLSSMQDDLLDDWGLDWDEDVSPWLGTQVGMILTPGDAEEPGFAFLIATTDEGATEAAMSTAQEGDEFDDLDWSTREHSGTTIHSGQGSYATDMVYAVTDGVLILSDDAKNVEQVIDASSASLADDEDYQRTVEALPAERLGTAYLNYQALLDVMRDQGLEEAFATQPDTLAQLEAIRGMGMSVAAEEQGMAMRMVVNMEADEQAPADGTPAGDEVLSWAPEDAYGLVVGNDLDRTLDSLLAQLETIQPGTREGAAELGLTDAIDGLSGPFGIVVSPQDDIDAPGGAVLMGVDDPASMRTFMDSLADLIAGQLAAPPDFMDPGFDPTEPTIAPLSLHQSPFSPFPSWTSDTYEGIEIRSLQVPELALEGIIPAYAVTDEMAIIATSPQEIEALIDASSGANITTDDTFEAAMEHANEDASGIFFLNLERIIAASGDAALGSDGPDELAPLRAFIMSDAEEQDGMQVLDLFLLVT